MSARSQRTPSQLVSSLERDSIHIMSGKSFPGSGAERTQRMAATTLNEARPRLKPVPAAAAKEGVTDRQPESEAVRLSCVFSVLLQRSSPPFPQFHCFCLVRMAGRRSRLRLQREFQRAGIRPDIPGMGDVRLKARQANGMALVLLRGLHLLPGSAFRTFVVTAAAAAATANMCLCAAAPPCRGSRP